MKMIRTRKIYISLTIILIFSAALYHLSSIFYWSSDCPYFSLKFEMDDKDPYQEMDGVKDLFESQCAHYMNWSGRFFCQFIVQFFCAFTSRTIFEICNIAVFLSFLVLAKKITGIKFTDSYRLFILTALSFLIFLTLPLDPPFLVNYLWMGTIILGWLIFFLLKHNEVPIYFLPFIFLYSIIAGNSQEAFSIPLSGALFIWLWAKKFKIPTLNVICISGFFIGTIILTVAPGNWIRLSDTINSPSAILRNIVGAWPQIAITFLILIVSMFKNAPMNTLNNSDNKINTIILLSIPFSLVLAVSMEFNNLIRILIPMNILLMIHIIGAIINFRHKTPLFLLICSICLCSYIYEYNLFNINYKRNNLVAKKYHESETGKVYIPDDLFTHNYGYNNYYSHGFVIKERHISPSKPILKILPESLSRIDLEHDSCFISQIGHQAWVFGLPSEYKGKIIIKRTILPKILNIPLPNRIIERDALDQVSIDTINNIIIGYYNNNKWYMNSSLTISK